MHCSKTHQKCFLLKLNFVIFNLSLRFFCTLNKEYWLTSECGQHICLYIDCMRCGGGCTSFKNTERSENLKIFNQSIQFLLPLCYLMPIPHRGTGSCSPVSHHLLGTVATHNDETFPSLWVLSYVLNTIDALQRSTGSFF